MVRPVSSFYPPMRQSLRKEAQGLGLGGGWRCGELGGGKGHTSMSEMAELRVQGPVDKACAAVMTPSSWSRTKASVTAADSFWWEQGKPEMGLGAEAAEARRDLAAQSPASTQAPLRAGGRSAFLEQGEGTLWNTQIGNGIRDADMAGKSLS